MSKPTTILTLEEWHARLIDAGAAAEKLITIADGMTSGPGQSVLALMLAARALCVSIPALPDFEWYFRRVSELGCRTPPSQEGPPS